MRSINIKENHIGFVQKDEDSVKIEDLENLVEDPNLEQLEDIINQFNIFYALDIVKAEVKHSRFLYWLLDPLETHGFEDNFLKLFLKAASKKARAKGLKAPSVVDFDSWDLDKTEVQAEWNGIDILIRNDEHHFICVVENKVESHEHSSQLHRYREIAEAIPTNFRIYVYLTPKGEKPSDGNYLIMTYSEINELLTVLLRKQKHISDDVITFVTHYKMAIERDITMGEKVKQLSKSIYLKHRKALEFIQQNMSGTQSRIHDVLISLIDKNHDLVIDDCTASYVRFIPRILDEKIDKGTGTWTSSKRVLLFEFKVLPKMLKLDLEIGPGDDQLRKKLFDLASKAGKSTFNSAYRLYPKWTTIYSKVFLDRKSLDELDPDSENLEATLEQKLDHFIKEDMPRIVAALTKEKE